jgi:hypothetical protein
MTLDHFALSDPNKQDAYDVILKAHTELLIAGVLADMAGYDSGVLSPLEDALRNVESALRIIRGENRSSARPSRGALRAHSTKASEVVTRPTQAKSQGKRVVAHTGL